MRERIEMEKGFTNGTVNLKSPLIIVVALTVLTIVIIAFKKFGSNNSSVGKVKSYEKPLSLPKNQLENL